MLVIIFSPTKPTLYPKISCLLEWLCSKQNLRVAKGDKVGGGIPSYFTRDWRRIEEDKSRASCPIIKKESSSPLITTPLCAHTLVNKWEFICTF
jgi:hypothetical protein